MLIVSQEFGKDKSQKICTRSKGHLAVGYSYEVGREGCRMNQEKPLADNIENPLCSQTVFVFVLSALPIKMHASDHDTS